MNRHVWRVLLVVYAIYVLSVPSALQAEPAPATNDLDCASFRDGDVLYGKLLGIQSGSAVRWQHPDSPAPIDFKPDAVAQIDFAPRASSAVRENATCKLWLASGDMLEGDVSSCDRNFITLDTWYAGRLKIPRRVLQTLAFNPRTPILFGGIAGLDGWTQGTSSVKTFPGESGHWLYRNGAFYSDKSSSIAKDFKLPDRSQIQFDLTWKSMLNLAIAFYTDSLQPINLVDKENGPDFGGFYSMRFNNTIFVSLMAVQKKEALRPLGDQLIVQSLQQKDRVHVDVRMSRTDKRVALFLDGTLVKDWIDPAGFVGEGGGIRFVNNGIGGAVKISNMRVSKWNGVLDEAAAEAPDPLHDVLTLETGSKVSGAVTAIADGKTSVLTTAGTTNVLMAGVSSIEFARYAGQAPPPSPRNAHATFVQGGSVTFQLVDWQPSGITAISPDFGKVTFDPAAFRHLQFLTPEPK